MRGEVYHPEVSSYTMAQSIHTGGQIAALPPVAVVTTLLVIPLAGYIVYQRLFHPLARFPGPFLASLTDLWQCYQFLTLKQPYNLTELHAKYGNIVRYGPNKLSVTSEDAVQIIYQKGGRLMPKSDMYVAFGTGHPNSFAMRDEAVSAFNINPMDNEFSLMGLVKPRRTRSEDVTCPIAFPAHTSRRWRSTWTPISSS